MRHVIWNGIADRLIGTIVPGTEFMGKVTVRRIDGTECRVKRARLTTATPVQVDLAISLGGCIIPPFDLASKRADNWAPADQLRDATQRIL